MIGSSSILAAPGLAAYTATKMALLGYAETVRLELAEERIGVTAILPAGIGNASPRKQRRRATEPLRRITGSRRG